MLIYFCVHIKLWTRALHNPSNVRVFSGSSYAIMSSVLSGAHGPDARKALMPDLHHYWSTHTESKLLVTNSSNSPSKYSLLLYVCPLKVTYH